MTIREDIKKSIPEKARYFLRLDNYRDLFFYISILFKRLFFYCFSIPSRYPLKQVINTISVELNLLKKNDFNIALSLRESGFSFQEGRHCVYLSDKDDLTRLLGDVVSNYPQPVGLKIIKSKEISPDGTPFYTSARNAPASNSITMRAVGSLLEKVIISNILSLSGFAPRVYDLIRFKISGCQFFGIIVQHIDGDQVTGKAGLDFMDSFRRILKKENVTIVAVKRNKDFQPPDFNHNIYSSPGGAVYIDIQNFGIFPKKGNSYPARFLRLNSKLKSAPKSFELFLSDQKVDLKGGVIFDMGCPSGLFTSLALSLGAFWSYILTQNEEGEKVKRFLFENGFSRFQLNKVSNQNDFEKITHEIKLLFFHVNHGFDALIRLVHSNHIQNLLLDFDNVESNTIRKRKVMQQLNEIGYFCTDQSLSFCEDFNMILYSKRSSAV